MDPVSIQFSNVTKTFGNETILDGFDLKVRQGELVSIVGPSGCGKSTLLRMISGLEDIDSGELEVSIPSHRSTAESMPVDRTAAFVFQEANLLPWLNTFDNVALPFRISNRPVERAKVGQVLELVGLSPEDYGKFPSQLSGGMKMRVSIARALVLDPFTLLLDEPFAALDDLLRTALNLKLMEVWQRDKQTMLFVTHNIAEAIFISQRVLIMGRGTQSPAVVEIDFSYPREPTIKASRKFADTFAEVSSLLEKTSSTSTGVEA